jgi:hypothetical protein
MKTDGDRSDELLGQRMQRFVRVTIGGLVVLWVGASIVIGVVKRDAAASLFVGGLLSAGAALGGLAAASAGASPNGRPTAGERRVIWRVLGAGALLLAVGGLFALLGLPAVVPLLLAFGAVLCGGLITLGAVLA